MEIEERVADLERRVSGLEAQAYRSQPPRPEPGLSFGGFEPGEPVALGWRGVVGEQVAPLADAELADGAGRVSFQQVPRLEPSPHARLYVARGQRSGRTVERPVGMLGTA